MSVLPTTEKPLDVRCNRPQCDKRRLDRAAPLCSAVSTAFFRSSFLLRLGPKSLSSSNDLSKQGLHKLSSGRITRLVHSPALWPCVSDAHRHFLTGWVAIAHSQRKGETKRINMSARLSLSSFATKNSSQGAKSAFVCTPIEHRRYWPCAY